MRSGKDTKKSTKYKVRGTKEIQKVESTRVPKYHSTTVLEVERRKGGKEQRSRGVRVAGEIP